MENGLLLLLFFVMPLHLMTMRPCERAQAAAVAVEDLLALQAFKGALDHDNILSTWRIQNASSDPCRDNWVGVLCSNNSEVTGLLLSGSGLRGSLAAAGVANLTHLSSLDLSMNKLAGALPAALPAGLVELNLSHNELDGGLPAGLGACRKLAVVDLSYNEIAGELPGELGNLTQLQTLELASNHLSGGVPAGLANASRLEKLDLAENFFSAAASTLVLPTSLTYISLLANSFHGPFPLPLLSSLSLLQYIQLGGNANLSGRILPSLSNCTDLVFIDVYSNNFTGDLASDLPSPPLRQLQHLELYDNHFSGSLPARISNYSSIIKLVLGKNQLSGVIPKELFRLQLNNLDLQRNAFGGSIPPEVGNLSLIQIALFNENQFSGSLPPQLGGLVSLQGITFELNSFTGVIPEELSNCTQLIHLVMHNNLLEGSIPPSIGRLAMFEGLWADHNRLTGSIPSELSNCTAFQNLTLNNNFLTGEIPPSLTALTGFIQFDLSHNFLSGSIPSNTGGMVQLPALDLSANNLSGTIPSSLEGCVLLTVLDLSANRFEGSIPNSLGSSLLGLTAVNLSHNSLSGGIPEELGRISYLQELDLSYNVLTGAIPTSLTDLAQLRYINLSFNTLSGTIPYKGEFKNFTSSSFLGNPRLCGQPLSTSCSTSQVPALHHGKIARTGKIGLAVAACFILFIILAGCFLVSRRRRNLREGKFWESNPFMKMGLRDIEKATNNFSEDNVLGSGATGIVYKGVTKDGKTLAFKRFRLESAAFLSFIQELNSIRFARHRNLIKILGYCSNRESYNILILEFLPNGSLEDHLHPLEGGNCKLSWDIRLRIAKGVAQGILYMHYDCPSPMIHCDIKPSNILLDKDMEACLTDFGLAKVMAETISSTQTLRGTLGYIAPEFGSVGQVSRKSDVYSYGVILMAMVTGRKPTDGTFGEGKTMVDWVQWNMEHAKVLTTFDKNMREDTRNHENIRALLKVALLCTQESPSERPTMVEVIRLLNPVVSA